MYHNFLIRLSADGHLGCFHVLAIVNSAVINTRVHVSLSILVSSVCMPSSGICGSYDSIFKSRDITLLTKVRLVKAMVFPVLVYGFQSWTVKKAEY